MRISSLAATVTTFSTATIACTIIPSVKQTFYGYPDNDPPGAATAYNCNARNYVAGGTGTYADPITFASAPGEFKKCEIIYIPYLKKYARMEDTCGQCTSDWNNGSGFRHIDIWTGSSTVNGGQDQLDCENALTPSNKLAIIRSPASNLSVDANPLYTKGGDPSCQAGHVYPNFNASIYC